MKTHFYLTVNSKGSVKTTKGKPSLNWDEVAISLRLELPDALFKKPALSASIQVSENDVQPKIISPEVIQNIQESILEHSGIELKLSVENPES